MIKKILLTLGLFILCNCFFNNCFAWNDYGYVGNWRSSNINSNFSNEMLKNGSFLSQYLGITYDSYLGGLGYYVFWTNDENYPIYYRFGGSYGVNEGYSTKFGVCNSFVDSGGNLIGYGPINCTFQNFNSGYKNILNGFFNNLSIGDMRAVNMASNNRCGGYGTFCINNSSLNTALCFGNECCGYGCENQFINSQGFGDFTNVPRSFIGISPFAGGGGDVDPIPDNGFLNTNRGVFDAYAEQGYVLSRCYSDFSLDNLATATGGIDQFYETELDDGVYYTGATVLDLFVEYGYGNSFESFFDYWYQTYNQSLTNDSPAKYVGLSKGLWNMSNKYYYAGLSNKYVDYTKFYNYCNYFVNFDGDWDAEYTGPQLPNDVVNQLAPSQSAIDYLSGFIHNQSSGNSQNFDANTFFTSLTTRFDRLLNNINGSFVGIIPGYILSIMMALIFIRIISH